MKKYLYRDEILSCLEESGEAGRDALDYITRHKVKLGLRRQGPATGAVWGLDGNIYFNPRFYKPDTDARTPELVSLVAHEACHLRQGWLTALSVYGELEAWQVGFRVRKQLTGRDLGPVAEEILTLELGWDRHTLEKASWFMQRYSGKKYRSDLLPLYPLPKEILYHLGLFPPKPLT